MIFPCFFSQSILHCAQPFPMVNVLKTWLPFNRTRYLHIRGKSHRRPQKLQSHVRQISIMRRELHLNLPSQRENFCCVIDKANNVTMKVLILFITQHRLPCRYHSLSLRHYAISLHSLLRASIALILRSLFDLLSRWTRLWRSVIEKALKQRKPEWTHRHCSQTRR